MKQKKEKGMKKTSLLIVCLALMSVVMTSCKKDEIANASKFAFRAYLETNGTKTHFGPVTVDGNQMVHYPLVWDHNDAIMVSNGTIHLPYRLTMRESTGETGIFDCQCEGCGEDGYANCIPHGPYHAVYPASIWEDGTFNADGRPIVTIPDTQIYNGSNIYQYPMYAVNDGARRDDCDLHFSNLCSAIELTLTEQGCKVTSISITTDKVITGDFDIVPSTTEEDRYQIVASETYSGSSNGSNTITLDCGTGVDISTATNFYIYLPTGEYSEFTITITTTNDGGETEVIEKKVGTGNMKFNRNHIKWFETSLPYGGLCGLYSVDGDTLGHTGTGSSTVWQVRNERQVFLSSGNLQFNASLGTHAVNGGGTANGTWRFAANHFEYTPTESGWVSLFYWGTSGYQGGQPAVLPSGLPNSEYATLTGSYANYDWGVYNAIVNGGNVPNMWRTLTYEEWDYLFNTRNASTLTTSAGRSVDNVRYTRVKVGDYLGIMVFPDEFEWPDETIEHPRVYNDASGNNNHWSEAQVYTYEEWAILEAACCAFLPVEPANNNRNMAKYWASTSSGSNKAMYIYLNNGNIRSVSNPADPTNYYSQSYNNSFCVRLVRDYVPGQE